MVHPLLSQTQTPTPDSLSHVSTQNLLHFKTETLRAVPHPLTAAIQGPCRWQRGPLTKGFKPAASC